MDEPVGGTELHFTSKVELRSLYELILRKYFLQVLSQGGHIFYAEQSTITCIQVLHHAALQQRLRDDSILTLLL